MGTSPQLTKQEIISHLEALIKDAEFKERGMNMLLLSKDASYKRGTLTISIPYGVLEQIVKYLKKTK